MILYLKMAIYSAIGGSDGKPELAEAVFHPGEPQVHAQSPPLTTWSPGICLKGVLVVVQERGFVRPRRD